MKMCLDCYSHNVVDIVEYLVYFCEEGFLKLRIILIYEKFESIKNDVIEHQYVAICPELCKSATAIGISEFEAIHNLGKILEKLLSVKLLGNKIDKD